ncbi:MAG: site-specific integrase [Candidatus Solibacter usitatus]|nr:site-specific integrase [Candidatus Solibacter usitatus]
MAVYRRGGQWWYSFVFAGKRVQEAAKTTLKTVAREAEKNRRRELEKSLAGMPVEKRENRILSVADVVRPYQEHYGINHRTQSVLFSKGRLVHVTRLLGNTLLPDLTETAIRRYIRTRLDEGASGRTINMEAGELSRAIGKPWSFLWPKVRKLEERKDAGRALTPEEEQRLVEAADRSRSPILGTFVRVALLTGMRSGEIASLTWGQVDLARRVVTVGRAKTASGTGRQIPMNQELFEILSAHAQWFTERFGETRQEFHLFPFGKPTPIDPTRPTTTMKTAWATIRDRAGVRCRLHDLRHTAATKMAEAGVSESTMLSLMGHMSRAMLERYSHIRMAAKREAVEALSSRPKGPNSERVSTVSTTVEPSARIQ